MNHSVTSDEELIALLERTMREVSECAPDMEFSTTGGNQRWMASAAAATVLVVGVGAAGLALNARHDAPSPLSPGGSTTVASTDGGPIASTTTSIVAVVHALPLDPRDDAWRAAVYQEMSAFGTCATANVEVGPGTLFNAKTACYHFADGQPVDGNIVFTLEELPFPTLADSVANWTKNGTGSGAPGVPLGKDAVMFVEKSNGITRRVAIVTAKHAVVINAELIDDKYLPTGEHDLTAVAQDLHKVADSILHGTATCARGTYVLQKGDTPSIVAQTFNMTVEALKAANLATKSFEAFPPGLKVNIPCTVPTPTIIPKAATTTTG
jgi:LysM repeat protein